MQPYFALTHMIHQIKELYLAASTDQLQLIEREVQSKKGEHCVKTGGRIIGRRKVSKDLLFLDIQSNGNQLQVMLDHVKLEGSLKKNPSFSFKDILEACSRGAIIGIEGYPGRTAAGEFTIIASEFNLLAPCDKNLPMMNWSHKKTLKDSELRF